MTKLHELLAIEGDLKGAKQKIKDETSHVFSKKSQMFYGNTKKLEMFDESRAAEEGIIEKTELATTVKQKLDYMKNAFIPYFDCKLQKEKTNQSATASIEIEDIVISDLPVSFILSMEDELKQLRKVYEDIPTLDNSKDWISDPISGDDIFKLKDLVEKTKTEKKLQFNVIVPATEKFPAQVKEWTEDVPVGKYTNEYRSGAITSARKSKLLSNIDKIIREFKKARQRANSILANEDKIGESIFTIIHAN